MYFYGNLKYSEGKIISFDDENAIICEDYYSPFVWSGGEWKQRIHSVSRYMIYDSYANMAKGVQDRFKGELVYSGKCFDLKIGQKVYFMVFES